jgi:ABC-type multidrug transport system fused ATPase/permease subunit
MTCAQLIALIWPWRGRMTLVAALMLVESLAMLAVPWFGGQLAGRMITEGSGNAAGLVVVVLGLLSAVAALRICVGLLSGSMSLRFLTQLQSDLHDHLQSLPVPFHEGHQRGDLLALSTWEIRRLSGFLTGTLVALPPMLLTAIGSIAIMFTIDPMLALAVPVMVPLFYLILKIIGRRLRTLAVAAQKAEAEAMALAEMHLEMLPAIKSFTQEDLASERYGTAIAHARDIQLKEVRISAVFYPIVQLVASGAAVVLVVLAGRSAGDMTAGELVAFLMYAALLTRPVSQLANVYGQIQTLKGMLERLGRVFNTAPEREPKAAKPLDRAQGHIAFNAVSFAYPDRPHTLHGVDLVIPSGQTLALTGANGVGKTTLAGLLLRFLEPDRGAVLLDGIPVGDLQLADLRRQIGVVPQRPLLFNGTIVENIGFGRIGATQAEIEEACRLSQAHEFITSLPKGYATQIGSQGVRLSGGQGQRIALARALVKDPPILILDEATSMFDTEGESDFVTVASAALRDRTVILITHRPATLALADRIVRLDRGRIISDQVQVRQAS